MRAVRLISLALLLIGSASVPAAGQTVPSPYRHIERTQSLGLFGGHISTDRGDDGIGVHSIPIVGAWYTIHFTGPLSGEVILATGPSNRTVVERVGDGTTSELVERGDVDALYFSGEAGLRFHLTGARTWYGLSPYAAASLGVATDLQRSHDLEREIDPAMHADFGPSFAVGLGIGTDWFLSERLALRVDARDRIWRLVTPEDLSPSLEQETQWTHNLGVSLGVSVFF